MVEHGDTRVQYRSIAEIRRAIGVVEQDIATAGARE
jgi:type II secretory pathway component PulJ